MQLWVLANPKFAGQASRLETPAGADVSDLGLKAAWRQLLPSWEAQSFLLMPSTD